MQRKTDTKKKKIEIDYVKLSVDKDFKLYPLTKALKESEEKNSKDNLARVNVLLYTKYFKRSDGYSDFTNDAKIKKYCEELIKAKAYEDIGNYVLALREIDNQNYEAAKSYLLRAIKTANQEKTPIPALKDQATDLLAKIYRAESAYKEAAVWFATILNSDWVTKAKNEFLDNIFLPLDTPLPGNGEKSRNADNTKALSLCMFALHFFRGEYFVFETVWNPFVGALRRAYPKHVELHGELTILLQSASDSISVKKDDGSVIKIIEQAFANDHQITINFFRYCWRHQLISDEQYNKVINSILRTAKDNILKRLQEKLQFDLILLQAKKELWEPAQSLLEKISSDFLVERDVSKDIGDTNQTWVNEVHYRLFVKLYENSKPTRALFYLAKVQASQPGQILYLEDKQVLDCINAVGYQHADYKTFLAQRTIINNLYKANTNLDKDEGDTKKQETLVGEVQKNNTNINSAENKNAPKENIEIKAEQKFLEETYKSLNDISGDIYYAIHGYIQIFKNYHENREKNKAKSNVPEMFGTWFNETFFNKGGQISNMMQELNKFKEDQYLKNFSVASEAYKKLFTRFDTLIKEHQKKFHNGPHIDPVKEELNKILRPVRELLAKDPGYKVDIDEPKKGPQTRLKLGDNDL